MEISAREKALIGQGNYFDALRNLCKRNSWTLPEYAFEEPCNGGNWKCVCTFWLGDRYFNFETSDPSKYRAKQLASKLLFEEIIKKAEQ